MEQTVREEKKENLIKYKYGYDNGFKIYKTTYYKNNENGIEKGPKRESLTFKIHEINKNKKLTYTYAEQKLEFLNRYEVKFFDQFTLEDFKGFKTNLEIICKKVKLTPNYGKMLEEIVNESNIKSIFEIINFLFSSSLFELMIEDGFAYLISENTIMSIKNIEEVLCINKEEKSLDKIWNLDKDVLKALSEQKINLDKILYVKKFIEERTLYEFKKLILEGGISIEFIKTINELLEESYEIDRFVAYVNDTSLEERLPKDIVVAFIADIKKISEELNIEFNPFMEELRDKHDEFVELYEEKQKEKDKQLLEESGKYIKIKQVEYKYNCRILKSIKEEDEDFLLKYIKRMKTEKLFIVEIIRRKDEETLSFLIIKGNKIIDAKSFYSIDEKEEVLKYINGLSKRNNWHKKLKK